MGGENNMRKLKKGDLAKMGRELDSTQVGDICLVLGYWRPDIYAGGLVYFNLTRGIRGISTSFLNDFHKELSKK